MSFKRLLVRFPLEGVNYFYFVTIVRSLSAKWLEFAHSTLIVLKLIYLEIRGRCGAGMVVDSISIPTRGNELLFIYIFNSSH